MSNSKLTKSQKSELKSLRADYPGVVVHSNFANTVIASRVAGSVVEFSVSVMSPDEMKFRRKVGEYHARRRMTWGEAAVMSPEMFTSFVSEFGFVGVPVKQ